MSLESCDIRSQPTEPVAETQPTGIELADLKAEIVALVKQIPLIQRREFANRRRDYLKNAAMADTLVRSRVLAQSYGKFVTYVNRYPNFLKLIEMDNEAKRLGAQSVFESEIFLRDFDKEA